MKFALFSSALLAGSVTFAATPINGWYASAFGGYTYLSSNLNTRHFGPLISNLSYTDGYNAGGRIGFQSNPIRYEFEYTYLSAQLKRIDVFNIDILGIKGNSSANLLMANLYYDFPQFLDAISPFGGVGIGYAFMSTSITENTPFYFASIHANRNAFAYQGTVGLTYNFSENYAINAAYRYTATTSNGNFGTNFQTQMGNFGVIYRFDTADYK